MEKTPITGPKLPITIAAMSAALLALLDISIVNVALTDIRASFGTPLDQIAWVSTGYAMANVTVIPMSGWFQRRFGFKRYFAASIALFTLASILCGMAWSLPSLVGFRVLQGIGGGAIIPTAQGILFGRYTQAERGLAGALFGLGAITGPLLGPSIGGLLIEHGSWHLVFLVNIPVGLLAAGLTLRYVEEPDFQPSDAPVDRFGIALLAMGMVSLQYVLEEGNREGWMESEHIVVAGIVALASLVSFVVHELETEHPVVDLSVFRYRGYAAATALNFLVGTALFAGSFLFSLFAGTIMRYSALQIGMLFLVGSSIQLFMLPLAGKLVGKVDARLLIALGIGGVAASLFLNGQLTTASDGAGLTLPIFVRSTFLGFAFVPLQVVAMTEVKPHEQGSASGLFNLTRELGGTIGTAWMSTALTNHTALYESTMSASVGVGSDAAREQLALMMRGPGAMTSDALAAAYRFLDTRIAREALVRSFGDGFTELAIVFLLALGLLALLDSGRGKAVDLTAAH